MTIEKIKLGGREFEVPPLVARQLIPVVPALLRLRGLSPTIITEQDMKDLYEVCFLSAQRGTPSLTREEFFDNMQISVDDMVKALPSIVKQAGLVVATGDAVGEAQAGTKE